MKCSKAQELLSSYLENSIEPPMRVALEQHFAECAQCASAYDRFHAAAMMLDELPEMEPPPGFHAAVMARMEQARRATPRPVRWWNVDWQSVFNARVPVRAVAMGVAVLLVLAVVVQLTPLNGIMANLIWQPGYQKAPVKEDPSVPKMPLPENIKQRARASYVQPGSGISIGVTVDSRNDAYTFYLLRLTTNTNAAIPARVFLLSDGVTLPDERSADSVPKVFDGSVSPRGPGDVPVVVTRGAENARSVVAQVMWEHGGRRYHQYLFLPPEFDLSVPRSGINAATRGVSLYEKLNAISAGYGIVVLASGDLRKRAPAVEAEYDDPESGLYCSLLRTDLRSKPLVSSIYVVEPKR
ncbi:MAG: hypothetical protein A2Z18_07985 [Armatimonadetes bacterium RBG_16_58_9]|nr:MAG: hypothetical protein A2Z18_07985 [Armatimonadetes bacterium RBG_16_58_9]